VPSRFVPRQQLNSMTHLAHAVGLQNKWPPCSAVAHVGTAVAALGAHLLAPSHWPYRDMWLAVRSAASQKFQGVQADSTHGPRWSRSPNCIQAPQLLCWKTAHCESVLPGSWPGPACKQQAQDQKSVDTKSKKYTSAMLFGCQP